VKLYFINDLINDLYELTKKFPHNIIELPYDELIIRIWKKNKKEVALSTIMGKLRKLEEAHIIKIIKGFEVENGILYGRKARVIIYRHLLQQLLPERTMSLNRNLLFYYINR